MKQLHYVLRTMWHNRGTTLIKVVSLGLAITMCALLFARIAYLQSFDTGFNDYKKLYGISMKYGVADKAGWEHRCLGPLPKLIAEAYPDDIESYTTTFNGRYCSRIMVDDREIKIDGWAGEPDFFKTLGIDIIEGNPETLLQPDNIFVSEETAKKIGNGESPTGTTVRTDGGLYRIQGVYRTIADNSTVRPDAVFSLTDARRQWNFQANCWNGYFRLRKEIPQERLDAMIEKAIRPAYPPNGQWDLFGVKLGPLHEVYKNNEEIKRMCTIMAILCISLLLIASLNYVLLSISSLSKRAKAIGVQKCSGAGNGRIFGMFIWETALILALALLLAAIVTLNFREPIEEMLATPVSSLFKGGRTLIILGILAVVLLIGGVIPARTFASVPVSQVFRRVTERKGSWKRVLLFIEFAGVSFTCGLLCIMTFQYRYIVDNIRNYNPAPMALESNWTQNIAGYELVAGFLRSLPYVEDCAGSSWLIADSFEGTMIDNGIMSSISAVESNMIDIMELKILHGRTLKAPGEMLINEKLMNSLHLTPEKALNENKVINPGYGGPYTIVGIVGDIDLYGAYDEAPNSMIVCPPEIAYNEWGWNHGVITVKLKPPYKENLNRLNEAVAEAYPDAHAEFTLMPDVVKMQYSDIRIFRNSVLTTSVIILLTTLMGLIGFVADEIQRRRKEIAIRKVNGAETADILALISRNIMLVAVPAVAVGAVAAAWTGNLWMQQFAAKIENLWIYYILTALAVLGAILLCVTAMTVRTARENPALSLKSE